MNTTSASTLIGTTRARLLGVAMAGAVGLALFLGGGAAHAQDNASSTDGSMPCTPLGQDGPPTIPEETVIKVGDDYYQCLRGHWWKLPRAGIKGQVTPSRPNLVAQMPVMNLSR